MKIIDRLLGKTPPKSQSSEEAGPAKPVTPTPVPVTSRSLREFVYLDAVSLRSLLSSQKGEMVETISEAVTDAVLSEAGGGIGIATPVIKGELNTQFQTTNSSTQQTSRKAFAESWFREFHAIPGLRLIQPPVKVRPASSLKALKKIDKKSVIAPASALVRGELVEFRVRLKADPVFHLGSAISEFVDMAEDHPQLVTDSMSLDVFRQGLVVNKLLHRLLVGLVPIRGEAVDYRVVEIDGVEHIVHVGALTNLSLPTRPLELVGVTEKSAYWKDLRRILFSESEFTLMCRVSRTGLQSTWTPVKLVDVFAHMSPDLADTINAAGRAPFLPKTESDASKNKDNRLVEALRHYTSAIVAKSGQTLTRTQKSQVERRIAMVGDRIGSATSQRSAFASASDLLTEILQIDVDPDIEIECREQARLATGLPLFPSLEAKPRRDESSDVNGGPDTRLLDVEVIAIYW